MAGLWKAKSEEFDVRRSLRCIFEYNLICPSKDESYEGFNT